MLVPWQHLEPEAIDVLVEEDTVSLRDGIIVVLRVVVAKRWQDEGVREVAGQELVHLREGLE